MPFHCTACGKTSSIWTFASACVLVAGCNSLVGNSEHDVAAVDSTAKPSSDAGSLGVWGSGETDSGVSDGGLEGVDAAILTWDAGAETGGGDVEPPPIAFVQAASHDTKNSVTTVNVSYSSPQRAGDLDVVVVGWSDPTNSVRSVSDSAGNPYTLAAAPVSTSGVALAIYYAAHIAGAASNTVTVELDVDDFPCVAILEYSGASQIDQTAAGKGSGATASSGTVVASLARELVLGAGEPDQNGTANFASAGAGYTQRVITGVSGMIVEDAIASQIGSFTATGGLTTHSAWVMQIVTFK